VTLAGSSHCSTKNFREFLKLAMVNWSNPHRSHQPALMLILAISYLYRIDVNEAKMSNSCSNRENAAQLIAG
jgi:hypothetical protein